MKGRFPKWVVPLFFIGILSLSLLFITRFGQKTTIFAYGELKLDPTLESHAQDIRTVFITLFDADNPAPMPWGAFKTSLSRAPEGEFLHFTLTTENLRVMNRDTKELPKHLRLKARLDTLGQGGTDKPGDIVGEIKNLTLGSHVSLLLDRKIE